MVAGRCSRDGNDLYVPAVAALLLLRQPFHLVFGDEL
jgi:hypothetical protein